MHTLELENLGSYWVPHRFVQYDWVCSAKGVRDGEMCTKKDNCREKYHIQMSWTTNEIMQTVSALLPRTLYSNGNAFIGWNNSVTPPAAIIKILLHYTTHRGYRSNLYSQITDSTTSTKWRKFIKSQGWVISCCWQMSFNEGLNFAQMIWYNLNIGEKTRNNNGVEELDSGLCCNLSNISTASIHTTQEKWLLDAWTTRLTMSKLCILQQLIKLSIESFDPSVIQGQWYDHHFNPRQLDLMNNNTANCKSEKKYEFCFVENIDRW